MPVAPDDPWAGYARTVVEIRRPGVGDLVVRPAPSGQTGAWPWPSATTVHLLTVWDPGQDRPGPEVNRARQAALESELRAMTPAMWAAVGTDPDTGGSDEGVAVRGLAEVEVLRIAARYRQDAIFSWTPTEWAIVASAGTRRESLGWSVTLRPSGP